MGKLGKSSKDQKDTYTVLSQRHLQFTILSEPPFTLTLWGILYFWELPATQLGEDYAFLSFTSLEAYQIILRNLMGHSELISSQLGQQINMKTQGYGASRDLGNGQQ